MNKKKKHTTTLGVLKNRDCRIKNHSGLFVCLEFNNNANNGKSGIVRLLQVNARRDSDPSSFRGDLA